MGTSSPPARLIGYLRVSTAEQAVSGLGLEAQEAQLRAEFAHQGWELVELIRDEGESGGSMKRPGLRRALEAIAAGHADGLVVAKLDRLTRSVVDFAVMVDWFLAAEASLVALDFKLDTETPSGRLVANVIMAVADWERATIAARTTASLQAKRARGESIGRPAVVDRPDLAARIVSLRADGLSLQAICDQLNADGVPTPRGAPMWRRSSVQSAAGYTRPRPRRLPPQLPPLPRRRKTTR